MPQKNPKPPTNNTEHQFGLLEAKNMSDQILIKSLLIKKFSIKI